MIFLRRIVLWLIPEGLSHRRWRILRLSYALLAALAAGAVDLLMDAGIDHIEPEAVIVSGIVFVLVFAFVSAAFLLAREVSIRLGDRLAAQINETIMRGEVPQIDDGGWSVVGKLREGLYSLLAPRERGLALLREDVEYYRQLAEEMLGLEIVFELDGRLRWVNPAVEMMTGYTRTECLSVDSPFELWAYHKDRPMLRDLLERVARGMSQEEVEFRVLHKDGRLFWCSCRCYPLRDRTGQPGALRFSAQNIQPRKDADLKLLETVAALRRAQALKEHYLGRSNEEKMRMAALLEILNLGILFVDGDHRVLYVNQVYADMWHLGAPQHLVGMHDAELFKAASALRIDDDAYQRHVESVVSQCGEDVLYEIRTLDGKAYRERSMLVTGPEENGHPLGRVWIHEEITSVRPAGGTPGMLPVELPQTGRETLHETDIRKQTRQEQA